MGDKKPTIKLTFDKPRCGFWDGGSKLGGEFYPSSYLDKHPGKDHTIRWGCFELNFWFNCGSGRSWKDAVSIAKRRLHHLCKVQASIEVVQ